MTGTVILNATVTPTVILDTMVMAAVILNATVTDAVNLDDPVTAAVILDATVIIGDAVILGDGRDDSQCHGDIRGDS